MVQIMHNKYVQFLRENGVSSSILDFIVKGASSKSELPSDVMKTTITQAEIKLDQMRMKALTSDTSLKKSTPHKFYLSESRASAFVMI